MDVLLMCLPWVCFMIVNSYRLKRMRTCVLSNASSRVGFALSRATTATEPLGIAPINSSSGPKPVDTAIYRLGWMEIVQQFLGTLRREREGVLANPQHSFPASDRYRWSLYVVHGKGRSREDRLQRAATLVGSTLFLRLLDCSLQRACCAGLGFQLSQAFTGVLRKRRADVFQVSQRVVIPHAVHGREKKFRR
ncbi:unnamed protein product, partial [Ectocarpus sp. 8 AP-2014]